MLGESFFARPVLEVARDLIGVELQVDGVGGLIVETEAYHHTDPASHSYRKMTARTASMFGPGGRAYVYRSYGLHWCLNLVCQDGLASAVLVRALEPTVGLSIMAERRGLHDVRRLCAGPGRLAQALAVTRALDGQPLDQPPFAFIPRKADPRLLTGPRIGISRGVDLPWRFGLAGSRFLSRPFPR